MAIIIKKEDILNIVKDLDVVAAMEEGFIAYSNGNTIVPPVGELIFEEGKGETHIKYGYIKKDDFYVVKIASGFPGNVELGISTSQGIMLLFSQKTGGIVAVLLDEGSLTDIRTAAAGALVAKYFAPKKVKAIGIVGTGLQAELQLNFLKGHVDCKTVWVWGRNKDKAKMYKEKFGDAYDIHIAETTTELAQNCNLIVTTTPAHAPLILAKDIQAGTHITAMGSDTPHKQELDGQILAKADLIIADSIPQSKSRGEIYQAVKSGSISHTQVVELGAAIQNEDLQRINDEQISVADLTGVAVQDIMITKAVYLEYLKTK
ncbi:MAG: ornithine cyclodeaminase [Saprospiraceae bacterium]|jgi:ornithine cyclodeaminase